MTIRQTAGICPEAVILPPDPVRYRSTWEDALSALGNFSPQIEDEELGHAYLDLTGMQSHYRDEQELGAGIVEAVKAATGLTASAGIASGKLPAFAAATVSNAGETYAISEGAESDFLSALSVDLLPVDAEVISRLRLLGMKRIADVARLSVPELQSQFGFDGKRIWQLANGIDETPLLPRPIHETL